MNHVDLFSGIGGFSLSAQWAWGDEHNIVCFCEMDKFCQKVLSKHWPDVPCHPDIRTFPKFAADCSICDCCGEPFCDDCDKHYFECQCIGPSQLDDFGQIDLLTGGFPCQDISLNGKRKGIHGEQSGLWKEMARIIGLLRPRFVIIENVANLVSNGLETVLCDLAETRYDAEWFCLSAASFGACHKRERIFIIAYDQSLGIQGLWPQGFQIPSTLDKAILPVRDSDGQWKVEPDFRRVDDGVSNRMERLKSLGNSIVPQVAYEIMKAIKETDDSI